ncbi:MAG: nucleoside:proton symporter, partial [Alphaproteobacteria bacterium HGW-Alphaproteobacteria-13]
RGDVAGLGMKSWLAGNMVSLMTGAVIGLLTWS